MSDVHFALFEEATQALGLLSDVTELTSHSANWSVGVCMQSWRKASSYAYRAFPFVLWTPASSASPLTAWRNSSIHGLR